MPTSEKIDWSNLAHAYGAATDIPALLARLGDPDSGDPAAVWHGLWSALCHQGDVYSASFAAVPCIVEIFKHAKTQITFDFFALPGAIETARATKQVAIPAYLQADYFAALGELPALGMPLLTPQCDKWLSLSILAASAAAAGLHGHAKMLQEIESDDVPEVLDWYFSR